MSSSKSKASNTEVTNFVEIRNAPIDWTEAHVTRKFSHFGTIEDVTLDPQQTPSASGNSATSQTIIVEFENEEDAKAVVEEYAVTEEGFSVTFHQPASTPNDEVTEKSPPSSQGSYRLIPCSNTNCLKFLVSGDKFYCAPRCYFNTVDPEGSADMDETSLVCLGQRLMDSKKIDGVTITVDAEGNRSTTVYPPMTTSTFEHEDDFHTDILD